MPLLGAGGAANDAAAFAATGAAANARGVRDARGPANTVIPTNSATLVAGPPALASNSGTWPVYEITTYTGTSANITMTTTNYQVWRLWNRSHTAATCGYAYDDWPFECMSVTGTTSGHNVTVQQYVWGAWNEEHEELRELRAVTDVQTLQRYTRRKMTDAELRAALVEEKRQREEAEIRARKAEEAKARAEALLRLCLSTEQREDLDKKNCFYIVVDGKDGKKERYRIDRGTHGNVKQLGDDGSIIRSFCIQPPGVPEGDAMLAQKLYLEASEETRAEFWATANITTLMKEKEVPFSVPRRERRRYAEEHGLLH